MTIDTPQRSQNNLDSPSYSKIITPAAYNQIISEEHLYIATADQLICQLIDKKAQAHSEGPLEVVELGCGPGRLFPLTKLLKNINLTALDHDPEFIKYAKKIAAGHAINIHIGDIKSYQHPVPVDIFFSQGMHHHISKDKDTKTYLENIYNQLAPNGVYILSDEFIPYYENKKERALKLIIWYSHIIAHALEKKYTYLAQEEAKTLLDDLQADNPCVSSCKTNEQIQVILSLATHINQSAIDQDLKMATQLAENLNQQIKTENSPLPCGDNALDLSRGDYKICNAVFKKEVEAVGFSIQSAKSFGPEKDIGCMTVYTLIK